MNPPLSAADPEVASILDAELARQRTTLDLIASENAASPAVLAALAGVFTNKYAEGNPGRRYYAGNVNADAIETLAIERAKELFAADHANVQSHSGAQANAAAYATLAKPGDTILAMALPHGGHLTHGSVASVLSKTYRFVHYGVHRDDERIDMAQVRDLAMEHRPRIIVAGASSYPRTIDFVAFRAIADECGAYFMVDMAHIAGLVAADAHPSPVLHADLVTLTTHKTLRGPRGGMILSRADDRLQHDLKRTLAERVDSAVFPGVQGGPLMHAIAAKAVAFKEAMTEEFREYQRRTLRSARALATALDGEGVRIVTGGTDSHMVLADLRALGVSGKEAELRLERAGIIANRNVIPFDERGAVDPSGIRFGTPTLATRGMDEKEMTAVAAAIGQVLKRGDAGIDAAAATVRELCDAFPLYPTL